MKDIYNREPLFIKSDIPVFSQFNEYTENYEQISTDHLDSVRKNGTNPFMDENLWVEYEESTADLIRKYARPGDKILDVGVGLGRLMSYFPELERYGMDISFGYLEEAKASGINVCYSLIEDMPYKEEQFDIVVCTDVLEHVLDLNLCCNKILSTLKSGQVLIIRVPYREDLRFYAETPQYKYVHMRNFDEHSLRLFFERILGCEVLEFTKAGYIVSGSRLKYPIPFPKRDGILGRGLKTIRKLNPPAYDRSVQSLYEPIVINVVVRKP